MRKVFLFSLVLLKYSIVFSQAAKPSIMILPSSNWMATNNFTIVENNEGVSETVLDFESALLRDPDLNACLSKISNEFLKSGFKTTNLLNVINSIKTDAAEEALRKTSKGVAGRIRVNDIDVIRRVAKTDIEVHIYWNIKTSGPRKRVDNITITAIDTYTNQEIASAPGGSTDWVSISEVSNAELLREAVISQMDAFKASLQSTFDDMFKNGREIKLSILTWDSAPFDLEADTFGDDELNVLIKNWVRKNAYLGRFSAPTLTETRMEFSTIRIPISDENGRIDGEDWARGLVKYLKSIKVAPIKVDPKGLGHVFLILGGQ